MSSLWGLRHSTFSLWSGKLEHFWEGVGCLSTVYLCFIPVREGMFTVCRVCVSHTNLQSKNLTISVKSWIRINCFGHSKHSLLFNGEAEKNHHFLKKSPSCPPREAWATNILLRSGKLERFPLSAAFKIVWHWLASLILFVSFYCMPSSKLVRFPLSATSTLV